MNVFNNRKLSEKQINFMKYNTNYKIYEKYDVMQHKMKLIMNDYDFLHCF